MSIAGELVLDVNEAGTRTTPHPAVAAFVLERNPNKKVADSFEGKNVAAFKKDVIILAALFDEYEKK